MEAKEVHPESPEILKRGITIGALAGMVTTLAVLGVGIFLSKPAAAASVPTPVCEQQMQRASRAHGIPLNILYSVALTESGRGGYLQPFDIDSDGRVIRANDLKTALANVAAEQARGSKFIDVGCMQINIRFHASHFSSIQEMFDPAHNVTYAAALLKQLKDQQGTWTLAVARYNAGPNNDRAQKRYVCSVIGNMVSSGLGGWTPAARQFCDPSTDN